LRAVATKDGSTLWNLPLTSQKDEGAGQGYFFSDENTLYLISARFDLQGGTLHRIDLTKGTLKWSYNDPRISQTPGSKDSPFLKANQERVYGFGVVKPGLLALDAETGKPAWQVDNTNYYGLAATKDTLYSSDGKKLLAFAVASGTQSWSIDLPPNSHLTYWMQNTGNLLLLLQSNGVLAYGRA
jgi:outer membrane protein assembly factor BamB